MRRLYLLGVGTPTPTVERFGTAYVLQLENEFLMFDCGPAATHKLVKAGVFPTAIGSLFFTHHHFDHNADYPCFLLCRWDQSIGAEKRLCVYGPPPLRRITDRLIGPEGAFAEDWRARVEWSTSQHVFVNRGGALPRPAPAADVRELQPGDTVDGGTWSLSTAHATHAQPWLESLAYRVAHRGWSIVFAGDTGYCPDVVALAQKSDVLVVNCWDHQDTMESNGEASGQAGTRDAARMAREAGAGRLVLTHIGRRLAEPFSREKAIADIARDYAGPVVFGDELMRIEV